MNFGEVVDFEVQLCKAMKQWKHKAIREGPMFAHIALIQCDGNNIGFLKASLWLQGPLSLNEKTTGVTCISFLSFIFTATDSSTNVIIIRKNIIAHLA